MKNSIDEDGESIGKAKAKAKAREKEKQHTMFDVIRHDRCKSSQRLRNLSEGGNWMMRNIG